MALVGAGLGIDHDDATVAVTVGDVDLAGVGVDLDVSRLAEQGLVVAAAGGAKLADDEHRLAVLGVLEDGAVGLGVAGDPDESLAVDMYAVLVGDPRLGVGPTPALDEVAVGIELQDRRCGRAALVARRA